MMKLFSSFYPEDLFHSLEINLLRFAEFSGQKTLPANKQSFGQQVGFVSKRGILWCNFDQICTVSHIKLHKDFLVQTTSKPESKLT